MDSPAMAAPQISSVKIISVAINPAMGSLPAIECTLRTPASNRREANVNDKSKQHGNPD